MTTLRSLAPLTAPTGIRFKDRSFTEPVRFDRAILIGVQGIYAILVPDNTAKPRPYRVIYFGESTNIATRATSSHEKYNDWVREAAGAQLYVSYDITIGMTDEQRKAAENDLICHYNPVCNIKADHSTALFRALWGIKS